MVFEHLADCKPFKVKVKLKKRNTLNLVFMAELENDIKVLEFPECVRRRAGMYIGSTANPNVILREVIDNSVDELLLPNSTNLIKINVNEETGECIVGDNGRGIPDKIDEKTGLSKVELAVSKLHAGGKFAKGKSASVGLNGVGTKCILGNTGVTIKLANGEFRSVPISSLVGSSNVETYSIDNNGKLVSTTINKVWETKRVSSYVRVWLDSGDYFECTSDHKVQLSNGEYKEAGELTESDDLMSSNLKFKLSDVINGNVNVVGPLVYRIHNLVNGKSYVGSTVVDLKFRFVTGSKLIKSHLFGINNSNSPMYKDINTYGLDSFEVEILSIHPDRSTDIRDIEEYYVNLFNAFAEGYNGSPTGKGKNHNCNISDVMSRLAYKSVSLQKEQGIGLFDPKVRELGRIKARESSLRKYPDTNGAPPNFIKCQYLGHTKESRMKSISTQKSNQTGFFNYDNVACTLESRDVNNILKCFNWIKENNLELNEKNYNVSRWKIGAYMQHVPTYKRLVSQYPGLIRKYQNNESI